MYERNRGNCDRREVAIKNRYVSERIEELAKKIAGRVIET